MNVSVRSEIPPVFRRVTAAEGSNLAPGNVGSHSLNSVSLRSGRKVEKRGVLCCVRSGLHNLKALLPPPPSSLPLPLPDAVLRTSRRVAAVVAFWRESDSPLHRAAPRPMHSTEAGRGQLSELSAGFGKLRQSFLCWPLRPRGLHLRDCTKAVLFSDLPKNKNKIIEN